MNFDDWWHETGSGIKPLEGDDMEAHARRVAEVAWFVAMSYESAKLNIYEAKPIVIDINEAWMDSQLMDT